MTNAFPEWLRTMRESRGLSQQQMGEPVGIPRGTIAAYETGTRRPRTTYQRLALAEALQVSLESLYSAMGLPGPAADDIYTLIAQEQWEGAYRAIQQMQLKAYKTGDTAILAHAHELMSLLTAGQPMAAYGDTLHIDYPLQALDWGSAALRNRQWLSALALFNGAAKAIPPQSGLWGRLYNNLAITHTALGNLDAAITWDEQYIGWSRTEGNAWRVVVAHALAAMHKVLRHPGEDVARHLGILENWRDLKTGLPDPLVQCWVEDARVRQALARNDVANARSSLERYGRLIADHARCRGEQLRFAECQALLMAHTGETDRGALLLQTVLGQPEHLHEPAYARLEVTQSWARLAGTVLLWRQLMQVYWDLGARWWLERLLPEWQAVEPGVAIDRPPIVLSV